MVVTLFGPDGSHFGWMLDGYVFDAEFQPLAFPDGDDLYSFSECRWLGVHDSNAVYGRDGRVVAISPGFFPLRIVPSRLGRLPPRIKPLASPLPKQYRSSVDVAEASHAKRWAGLDLVEWLGQEDP